ncbi:carbohydrate kinase family protein [Patescibacteria group bacterium]
MNTKHNKFDLVTIGDATWDVFMKIHNASISCSKNHSGCKLSLDYGGKIGVDQLHSSVGGNATNIAVASSKLGINTAFAGFMGSDEVGKKAINIIKKSGVNTDYVVADGQTNQSSIISFQDERTILSYKEKRNYKLGKIPNSNWVFLTSTGPGSEKFVMKIISKTKHRKIVYNPGSYHLRLGKDFIKKIIKNVYCLIVNLDEAHKIISKKPNDIKETLYDLSKLGPDIVVITNSREGAYVRENNKNYHISSIKVKVIDPTGAGDSFSATFVSALIYEKSVREALLWGILNSTSLIQKLGTEEGLLNIKQLQHKLKIIDLKAIEF